MIDPEKLTPEMVVALAQAAGVPINVEQTAPDRMTLTTAWPVAVVVQNGRVIVATRPE